MWQIVEDCPKDFNDYVLFGSEFLGLWPRIRILLFYSGINNDAKSFSSSGEVRWWEVCKHHQLHNFVHIDINRVLLLSSIQAMANKTTALLL